MGWIVLFSDGSTSQLAAISGRVDHGRGAAVTVGLVRRQ
jgi:hypothetical protein